VSTWYQLKSGLVGYKADITLLTLAQPLVKPIDSAGWVFIIVEKITTITFEPVARFAPCNNNKKPTPPRDVRPKIVSPLYTKQFARKINRLATFLFTKHHNFKIKTTNRQQLTTPAL
jgi:hypothetical protein